MHVGVDGKIYNQRYYYIKGFNYIIQVSESYRKVCAFKSQAAKVQQSEFHDIISQLDTLGLISVTYKRKKDELANAQVSLLVNPDDIIAAISTSTLLKGVLENGEAALK